jgi:hypothetical protein
VKRVGQQANHEQLYQLGGRRPIDGELSDELRRTLELRRPIPQSRSQCPQDRPCPYWCKHNAWVVSGLDQPGRRWVDGELPPTKVQPTVDRNCVLDYAEAAGEKREPTEVAQVAEVLGVCDRQVRRYAASAMAKLPVELATALDSDEKRADAVALLRELMA